MKTFRNIKQELINHLKPYKMKTTTRELILNKIDEQKQKIELNNQIIKTNPEFIEFNTLENILIEVNIKLMKIALIQDDIETIFTFTDQL